MVLLLNWLCILLVVETSNRSASERLSLHSRGYTGQKRTCIRLLADAENSSNSTVTSKQMMISAAIMFSRHREIKRIDARGGASGSS
jgi:hypothetical protein